MGWMGSFDETIAGIAVSFAGVSTGARKWSKRTLTAAQPTMTPHHPSSRTLSTPTALNGNGFIQLSPLQATAYGEPAEK
jgi:hypothetical protein